MVVRHVAHGVGAPEHERLVLVDHLGLDDGLGRDAARDAVEVHDGLAVGAGAVAAVDAAAAVGALILGPDGLAADVELALAVGVGALGELLARLLGVVVEHPEDGAALPALVATPLALLAEAGLVHGSHERTRFVLVVARAAPVVGRIDDLLDLAEELAGPELVPEVLGLQFAVGELLHEDDHVGIDLLAAELLHERLAEEVEHRESHVDRVRLLLEARVVDVVDDEARHLRMSVVGVDRGVDVDRAEDLELERLVVESDHAVTELLALGRDCVLGARDREVPVAVHPVERRFDELLVALEERREGLAALEHEVEDGEGRDPVAPGGLGGSVHGCWFLSRLVAVGTTAAVRTRHRHHHRFGRREWTVGPSHHPRGRRERGRWARARDTRATEPRAPAASWWRAPRVGSRPAEPRR